MVSAPGITLRDAAATDQPFLNALFHANHRADFAPLGLPESALAPLLDMQANAQRLGYAREFPRAHDRILLDASTNEAIGRLLTDDAAGILHLIDIALLPSAQGRGVGTALLRSLLAEAKAADLRVQLSVNPGSRALSLYSRLGFQIVSLGMPLRMEFSPGGSDAHGQSAVHASALRQSGSGAALERLVGAIFLVEGEVLSEISELRLADFRWTNQPRSPESFSLLFHGPLSPVLEQAIYCLRAPAGAAVPADVERLLCAVFLVPVGPAGHAMQYEAVFNL
jgi:ribosomal protein S18 acetylase RimI-like enzyme